jgi:hypothetical protein
MSRFISKIETALPIEAKSGVSLTLLLPYSGTLLATNVQNEEWQNLSFYMDIYVCPTLL